MSHGILGELPLCPSSSHLVEHRAVEGAILLPRPNAPVFSTPVQNNYSLRLTNCLFRDVPLSARVCLESLAAPSGLVCFGNSCNEQGSWWYERIHLSVGEIEISVSESSWVHPFLPHLNALDMFGHMWHEKLCAFCQVLIRGGMQISNKDTGQGSARNSFLCSEPAASLWKAGGAGRGLKTSKGAAVHLRITAWCSNAGLNGPWPQIMAQKGLDQMSEKRCSSC